MKKCKMCHIDKELSEYYLKKSGKPRSSYCKNCYNIVYKTKYDKEYYKENKDKFRENYKKWCEKNERTEYHKQYREENSEDLKLKQKEFRENNKELVSDRKRKYWKNLSQEKKEELKLRRVELYHENNYKYKKREYVSERLQNDTLFKLSFNIRSLIRNAFNRKFTEKSKKTTEILGCSFEEFKIYLESKFDENMNWENHGSYWHLDHIIPISSAKTELEVYRLNHYTNFQPLYWLDNLIKSDKLSS